MSPFHNSTKAVRLREYLAPKPCSNIRMRISRGVAGLTVALKRDALLLSASVLLTVGNAAAQGQPRVQAPLRVDVQTLGPQAGSKVPGFSLPDQHGQVRALESLMGGRGLVLVFFRSADW
jgi:hypothetical protein